MERIYREDTAYFAQLLPEGSNGIVQEDDWLIVDRRAGTTCVFSPSGQLNLANPLRLASNTTVCPPIEPCVDTCVSFSHERKPNESQYTLNHFSERCAHVTHHYGRGVGRTAWIRLDMGLPSGPKV